MRIFKDDEIILSDIRYAARHLSQEDRLFLMDGDALIIPRKQLVWILEQIRDHLPRVKRGPDHDAHSRQQ